LCLPGFRGARICLDFEQLVVTQVSGQINWSGAEIMNKLKDKVVVITGASSGIGWASAIALAEEGAKLVINARRSNRLEELATAVHKIGGQAISVIGDAREEETARRTVDTAINTFGSLDILINDVGVGSYKDLVDTDSAEYDEMIDTNLRSTFLFTKYAAAHMIKNKSGTILMISSMAGIYGFAGQAVYCASKFAQVGFAQALDKELRPFGIKVGVICPGGVKTEFALGKGRTQKSISESGMLEPEDVAGAVLLACIQSPKSRIIEIKMRTMDEALS
jgi:NADP-dependent 3-hydroxy acid dehydrogenase YdfG